jgi:hypothetical protein
MATELTIKRTITTMGQILASQEAFSHYINSLADGFQVLRAHPQVGRSADTDKVFSTYLVNAFCTYCHLHEWEKVPTKLPIEFVSEVSIRWYEEIR